MSLRGKRGRGPSTRRSRSYAPPRSSLARSSPSTFSGSARRTRRLSRSCWNRSQSGVRSHGPARRTKPVPCRFIGPPSPCPSMRTTTRCGRARGSVGKLALPTRGSSGTPGRACASWLTNSKPRATTSSTRRPLTMAGRRQLPSSRATGRLTLPSSLRGATRGSKNGVQFQGNSGAPSKSCLPDSRTARRVGRCAGDGALGRRDGRECGSRPPPPRRERRLRRRCRRSRRVPPMATTLARMSEERACAQAR